MRTVCVDAELEDELYWNLIGGPILKLADETGDNGDLVSFQKELVDRKDGFKVYIYADDHPPPHFHVMFGSENNSYSIVDGSPIHSTGGLLKYAKNIRKWHNKNRQALIDSWNRNCSEMFQILEQQS